jgi:hypothetical protein
LQPHAADAPSVRTRIESLGKPQEAAPLAEISAPDLTVATPGEAAVPGGLKAFAAIARLENQPDYDSFFLEYCRRLLHETSHNTADDPIPAYTTRRPPTQPSSAPVRRAPLPCTTPWCA